MSWGFTKTLKILLLLCLVISFTIAPIPLSLNEGDLVAHAQTPAQIWEKIKEIDEKILHTGLSDLTAAAGAAETVFRAVVGGNGQCGLSIEGLQNCIWALGYVLLIIQSFILFVVALIFDVILDILVFNMGATINKITVIDEIWAVFRDLANILFIFILLYAAIRIIIDSGTGRVGKLIGQVILIAIVINFSLFITKAVIDSSNILALQFNKAITTDGSGKSVSVGKNLMGSFSLQTLFQAKNYKTDMNIVDNVLEFTQNTALMQKIQIVVGGSILTSIAIFTLGLAAFMLLFRFIMLIILMILSPIAFVAHILPQTNSYAQKWWNMLIRESFYAPIFLLFLWVTLKIINSDGFREALFNKNNAGFNLSEVVTAFNSKSIDPFTDNVRGVVGAWINFALVIGFLLTSVLIGRFLGNRFSNTAMVWAKGARNSVVRNFAGGSLEKIRKSEKIQKMALSSNPIYGVAGRFAERGLYKATKGYRSDVDKTKGQVDRILKDTQSKGDALRGQLKTDIDRAEKAKKENEEKMSKMTKPYDEKIATLKAEEEKKGKEIELLSSIKDKLKVLEEEKMRSTAGLSPTKATEEAALETEKRALETSISARTINSIRSETATHEVSLAQAKNHPAYTELSTKNRTLEGNIEEAKKASEEAKKAGKERKREIEDEAVEAMSGSIFQVNRGAADKLRESIKSRRKAEDKKDKRDINREDIKKLINSLKELQRSHEVIAEELEQTVATSSHDRKKLEEERRKNTKELIAVREKIIRQKDILNRDDDKKGGGGSEPKDDDKN